MAFEFLKKALSEDNGNPSSTRVNVFFSNTQWSLAITFGFIWVVIVKPELIISYLGVMAALVAGLLGLKVWQKDKEQSSEPKNDQAAQ